MPRAIELAPRLELTRLTPAQAMALVVPAALGSFALVLAVANASSRGFGLFYGIGVILLAGLAMQRGGPRRPLPRWFVLQHPMAIPFTMLFFALLRPLIG